MVIWEIFYFQRNMPGKLRNNGVSCPQLILRHFRKKNRKKNESGKIFVNWYSENLGEEYSGVPWQDDDIFLWNYFKLKR